MTSPTRDEIEVALGGVLFNVSNYPEAAQLRMMGQDFTPLLARCTDAVLAVLDRHAPATPGDGTGPQPDAAGPSSVPAG